MQNSLGQEFDSTTNEPFLLSITRKKTLQNSLHIVVWLVKCKKRKKSYLIGQMGHMLSLKLVIDIVLLIKATVTCKIKRQEFVGFHEPNLQHKPRLLV